MEQTKQTYIAEKEELDYCRNLNIKKTFIKQLKNELVVGSY